MQKNYKYKKVELRNLPPFFIINDPPYFQEDLFELIGSHNFTATFSFKVGSESQNKFGDMLTGTIFYPKGVRKKIQHCIQENKKFDDLKIRIILSISDCAPNTVMEIKYDGVPIDDIQSITFVRYRSNDWSKDGNKHILVNEIRIPNTQLQIVDLDLVYYNLLNKKVKLGTHLIPEEKAKLIGYFMAYHEGVLDPKLLKILDVSLESVETDNCIWYHYYEIKKRRNNITTKESEVLEKIEFDDIINKYLLLFRELKTGHAPGEPINLTEKQLYTITESLKSFRPNVLLPIKHQIWWNEKSYIHIVLRHVKDFQLGRNNINKTSFPYDFKQLKLLIEKVLNSVKDELKLHFCEGVELARFHRNGRMAIYYNGDYFALDIAPNGLLESIYIVESGNVK